MSILDSTSMFVDGSITDKQYMLKADARWRMIYPAPFFDPIAVQTIVNYKTLVIWSRFFYEWHPIINVAINKMVTYPITDFIYDTDDHGIRKKYEDIFDAINMRAVLERAGLDYFISGNTMYSCIMPFTRLFTCTAPNCGYKATKEDATFRPSANRLSMVCPKCKAVSTPTITDILTQDVKDFKPLLWNILNMDIEYDDLLSTYDYFYNLPTTAVNGILKGQKRFIASYPLYMIEAAHKKQSIQIFSDHLLHLKRANHSASYHKGVGMPLVAPVLKYLFHLLLLLRSQDAIAIDQILPWQVLSPAAAGATDPASNVNLGEWQGQVQAELNKWKTDPLRKSIMPIPINYQLIGGNGKAMMVTPEINEITQQILAGMGVPNEFVYGGLQWSGASVSLRMLENQFLNYRTMMQHVIDMTVKKISTYFGLPEIPIRMQSFKMADDVAQKDLIFRLYDGKLISGRTLLEEVMPTVDFDQEQSEIENEHVKQLSQEAKMQQMMPVHGLMPPMQEDTGVSDQQHGDLPEKKPPRAEGTNKQI